jgi:deoxyribodipyrimidine photo-lyase
MVEPNKKAAMDRLRGFLPKAGREYTATRNYDLGPDRRHNVSMLSPWVRLRLLPEWTILSEVLKAHSAEAAGKFIDEVCWHTYWKGWLQQHPNVWTDYRHELDQARSDHQGHVGYEKALAGNTGIDCFDAWTQELIDFGYLHNHARMWYASIWTHTLKLPWVLGADFFLRHLYDGDAAANTLGWRWVAGLHTLGKSYLARPGNIEKFTEGRFRPKQALADEPLDLAADYTKPPKTPIPELARFPKHGRMGLLLHDEDLSAAEWLGENIQPSATCGLFPEAAYESMGVTQTVVDFRRDCMRSVLPEGASPLTGADAVVQWALSESLDAVVLAEPPVGFYDDIWPKLREHLQAKGIALHYSRHWWDTHFHPQAGSGFFKFKKSIPKALDQL